MKKSNSTSRASTKEQTSSSSYSEPMIKFHANVDVTVSQTVDEPDFDADYEMGEEIGRGAFGVVNKCYERKTGDLYAVKVLPKRGASRQDSKWRKEAEILQSLNHPNIVQMKEIVETRSALFIVMEYVNGGELMKALTRKGNYSEYDARGIMKSILSAVVYLHSRDIVHRDLKPENILISTPENGPEQVKLADFGLSLVVEHELAKTKAGTPLYMGPEVLKGKSYSETADMWSIGVLMFLLLSGDLPFKARDENELIKLVTAGEFEFSGPIWPNISDEAKDLVSRLLNPVPSARYDAKEALAHPWFTGLNDEDARPLDTVLELMKAYNAERKFKKSVLAVMATHRLWRSVNSSPPSEYRENCKSTPPAVSIEEDPLLGSTATRSEPPSPTGRLRSGSAVTFSNQLNGLASLTKPQVQRTRSRANPAHLSTPLRTSSVSTSYTSTSTPTMSTQLSRKMKRVITETANNGSGSRVSTPHYALPTFSKIAQGHLFMASHSYHSEMAASGDSTLEKPEKNAADQNVASS